VSLKPDKISKYKIGSELGKGSMGVVFEGHGPGEKEPVAIKVFYPDTKLSRDETSVLLERFQREGSALSQLDHRNVVGVHEVGSEEDYDYIVMEKLEGFNLKELLTMGTRFTLAETFDIALQLLAGLGACHRAGVVHRDVKPANVVRAPDGTIKLADFGIARVVTDETLTRSGTIVGTPNYMSPEQIKGEDVDQRSDLFSVAVLMYELLTGKKPFDGPDVTSIMYNITNVHPPSPRFYNGALPNQIEDIIFTAMAKDPGKRYNSAQELSREIRELEQSLQYHDDSEAFLSALPSAPDTDAAIAPGSDPSAIQSIQSGGHQAPSNAPSASQSLAGPLGTSSLTGGIVAGKVFCVDCGMENDESGDFCVRCMRPLLKRDTVTKLAAKHAKQMYKTGRGDYIFLTCLSVCLAAVVILILYLFFRGVT